MPVLDATLIPNADLARTDWDACDSLIHSLRPDSATDPELTFLLSEARTEYLISRGLYAEASQALEESSALLKDDTSDVLHRVSLLLVKANLFAKIGKPERGFSVALRAASVAFKSRLMPSLWLGVALLSNILNSIGEFQAAVRLLHAVIPQSLEHADHATNGVLYSFVADSYIGLAGFDDIVTSNGARARAANMSRADLYIDRARDCYKKVEDIEAESEQITKKAIIARLRGDEDVAEDWAQNHNRVWELGKAKILNTVAVK